MVLNLAAVKGSVSIGPGQHSGSMGDVRASDYGGGLGDAVSAAVLDLAGAGGGIINVLPGIYDMEKNWEQTVGTTIVNLFNHLVLKKEIEPHQYLPLDIVMTENVNYYLQASEMTEAIV